MTNELRTSDSCTCGRGGAAGEDHHPDCVRYVARTSKECSRGFMCCVIDCPGTHEESWHMCWVPPDWRPDGKYKPGDRVVFGGHVWVRHEAPGMWERA